MTNDEAVEPKFIKTINGEPCITLIEHEYLMALQEHKRLLKAKETQQRTWVGLTDEEIAQGCKESWVTEQAWQSAVWWAEAKLEEKNGA